MIVPKSSGTEAIIVILYDTVIGSCLNQLLSQRYSEARIFPAAEIESSNQGYKPLPTF